MNDLPDSSCERLAVSVVMALPLDAVTLTQTVDIIHHFVRCGRSTGRTFQVATINVDFIVNAVQHADVQRLLQDADLRIADGMPVVWAARLQRTPLPERVTGADLVPALVSAAATSGLRVLLFGSATGVAERAADILRERSPNATVFGLSGPMMRTATDMDQPTVAEIRSFDADVICVALGNPKQERWIEAFRDVLGIPVLIGIGGTLDFLVGGRQRAPRWAQRLGLEWVFRAVQEPGRLGRRYAHDAAAFGPELARLGWRRIRSTHVDPGPTHRIDQRENEITVTIERGAGPTPAALADLASWAGHARRAGIPGTIHGVTAPWQEPLNALGIDRILDISTPEVRPDR